jgi:hypothetical protein
MQPLPVYFVDNVITTGITIAACRRALGWGTGLAYADASKPRDARRILLTKCAPDCRLATPGQAQALHDNALPYVVRQHFFKRTRVESRAVKKLNLAYPWDYTLPL